MKRLSRKILRAWSTTALTVGGMALLLTSCYLANGVGSAGTTETPSKGKSASDAPSNPEPSLRVVAFGHVDVDGGTVALSVPIAGQIEAVLVDEGEHVRAGQALVRLREEEALARLSEAQAAVAQATVQRHEAGRAKERLAISRRMQEQSVRAARSRWDAQNREVEQLAPLVPRNAVPNEKWLAAKDLAEELAASLLAEELKLEQLDLERPDEKVQAADANLAFANAKLQQAREYLRRHTLSAPDDGVVLRVQAAQGAMAAPGQGPPAVWFAPDKPRIVRCEVDQAFANRISVGMKARLYDGGPDGKAWTGSVERCGDWIAHRRSLLDEPFQKNDVRTLEVIVALDRDQPEPRIGERMRVEFLE